MCCTGPAAPDFSGNTCITEAINAYLIDGTVPEDGTECGAETVE